MDTASRAPYEPARGMRCNRAKLLLDPYARAISGEVAFGPEVLDYAAPEDPDAPSTLDSAQRVPRSIVVDDMSGWGSSTKPMHPYTDMVIYEVHVKGFTMRHPKVPPELRGTYAGLAHEAVIGHLVDLGVTAVELLPVHENVLACVPGATRASELLGLRHHRVSSLRIGDAQPRSGLATRWPGGEFKAMVEALHGAGMEVILDVVYNHTAEGNDRGPDALLPGMDNPAYYGLLRGRP